MPGASAACGVELDLERQRSHRAGRETVDRNSTTSANRRTTDSMAAGIDVDTANIDHVVGARQDATSSRAHVRPHAARIRSPDDDVAGAIADHRAGRAAEVRQTSSPGLPVGHRLAVSTGRGPRNVFRSR